MHLLDRNFSKNKILLPPEIYTVDISDHTISSKNLVFPWESGDFEVLLVEISGVLPAEISTIFFISVSAFTGKKNMSFGRIEKKCTPYEVPPPYLQVLGAASLIADFTFCLRRWESV